MDQWKAILTVFKRQWGCVVSSLCGEIVGANRNDTDGWK
jgi:hypothetical protein